MSLKRRPEAVKVDKHVAQTVANVERGELIVGPNSSGQTVFEATQRVGEVETLE